jgi:hypothetical protein
MVTRRARWSRRATIVTAVGIVVIVALDAVRATPVARTDARPNVVVVLVDDMGWSDIGPYGGEIPTPNLDALAGRGVRFTQFYSTPRCSPTRASLLTGVYPHQAGMGHLDSVIRPGSSGTTGRLNERFGTKRRCDRRHVVPYRSNADIEGGARQAAGAGSDQPQRSDPAEPRFRDNYFFATTHISGNFTTTLDLSSSRRISPAIISSTSLGVRIPFAAAAGPVASADSR